MDKSRLGRPNSFLSAIAFISLAALLGAGCCFGANEQQPPLRPWLRSRSQAARTQPQPAASPPPSAQVVLASSTPLPVAIGSALEVAAPPATPPAAPPQASNRSTRTAEIFQNGDGYNIFVTNTCERESMKVNIKTSRPFFGVIHTRSQRQKPVCSVEGNGDIEYNLEISHILNSQDANYCGVIRARRESPEDKDILSVVVAVRFHKNIELADDKFFLLNCTNRCRKPNCSNPSSASLVKSEEDRSDTNEIGAAEREGLSPNATNLDECTIWRFPWAITLLWCMAILLLAMIISHCIMCSSLMCRCVKTEVEEREPSVFEGADLEDDRYNRKHPYRIDYDNRDIYKTSNNYAPYRLEETQSKSRGRQKRSSREQDI